MLWRHRNKFWRHRTLEPVNKLSCSYGDEDDGDSDDEGRNEEKKKERGYVGKREKIKIRGGAKSK